MAFAIVTPTLDSGDFLRGTVDSVLACLGPEDRFTIVDGGSSDGSVEAVRDRLPPNAAIMRDGGGGMYDAIARGFASTDGEYMGWINASDLLLPGALETVRRAFESTGAELVHFDDLLVDEHGVVIQRTIGIVDRPEEAMREVGWTPLQDACFWTRALYERCGGVDPSWRFAGDFDFFLRAFHSGRTAYLPGVVSAFRRHPRQLSIERAGEYRIENRQARVRFAKRHPHLRGDFGRWIRRRLELSLRARSGRGRCVEPWSGRHWSTIPACIG